MTNHSRASCVAHTCSLNPMEAEAGRSQGPGQSETLFLKQANDTQSGYYTAVRHNLKANGV